MRIAELIESCAADEDIEFRNDYSGRCMYGKRCVGVVTDDLSKFLEFFAHLVRELDGDDEETPRDANRINGVREDSMGRQTIYYWPEIQPEGEPNAKTNTEVREASPERNKNES